MSFLLSSQNVIEYVVREKLCTQDEGDLSQIELKFAKNFNLLLSLPSGRKLLVKQERYGIEGKTAGEFLNEWRIQDFLQQFPELSYLRPLISEVLHFSQEHSIIVFNYLIDYQDLATFYGKENSFPTAIASAIGAILAALHRSTFRRQEYRDFFIPPDQEAPASRIAALADDLERVGPEIFGLVPADGLKFFALAQRYKSLRESIAELADAFEPCCVTHNDLKLNNILLYNDWEQVLLRAEPRGTSIVRLIDWERCTWGDPAFDLGMLLGSYLQVWLNSLVVSKLIDIEESLRMAITPLEQLQPSIAALVSAYFGNFPEVLEYRPQFLRKVMQFTGLSLIIFIQSMIQYQKTFGNTGVCMLQVAKGLLCYPEQSVRTIFGANEAELSSFSNSVA